MISSKIRGFTLVELLIAMLLLTIISSLAYPSYLNSIRVSRRTDAKQAMMEAAQKLESYYASRVSYTEDLRELGYENKVWNKVFSGSKKSYYRIRVSNPNVCKIENCFVIEAESIGDQSNDIITSFLLWSSGRKQKKIDEKMKEGWR